MRKQKYTYADGLEENRRYWCRSFKM